MKLYVLLVVVLIGAPAVGIVNMGNDPITKENETLCPSQFEIVDHGEYNTILLEGCSSMYRDGYPLLPYYTQTYVYPAGTKINAVHIENMNEEKITLSKKIMPSPWRTSAKPRRWQ